MKVSIIKITLSILVIVGFVALASSCKKSEVVAVDKTCKVSFILNLTNAAGDTTFVDGIAGELVKDIPVISRTGFQFDGWYANSADANPNPTKNTKAPSFPAYDLSVKPIYLDVILYARWIK